MNDPTLLLEERLPGGGQWSAVVKRGQSLRLTDAEGGANVALLAFNAHEKSERINLPDTLKAQHTSRLTAGHCIYSDMGRVLLAIVEDDLGWHDPIGGIATAEEVEAKYGAGRYQELRNACHRNGYDSLVTELGKWGLSPAYLAMNANLFSRVACDEDGQLAFVPGHSRPGASVELYAPMDTLVVLAAVPHPMDPDTIYRPRPVDLALRRDPGLAPKVEACRDSCPENGRGFELTERLYL
jgi:hypothetical protein